MIVLDQVNITGLARGTYSFMIKQLNSKQADFYFSAFACMDIGIESYIDQNIDSLTYEEALTYSNELYLPFMSNNDRDKII